MREEVRKSGRTEGKENSVIARFSAGKEQVNQSVIARFSSEQGQAKQSSLLYETANSAPESSTSLPEFKNLTPTVYFYIWDYIGALRPIMNSLGNIKSTHDYEPFGVIILAYNETASNRHKFTGQERDYYTGLDYMHFRYYASSIGRFMKPDNIIPNAFNPQSWNVYSYLNGNPVNFNDPSGHYAGGFAGSITNVTMKREYFAPPGGTAWELTMVEKIAINVTEYFLLTVAKENSLEPLGDNKPGTNAFLQYIGSQWSLSFTKNMPANSYAYIYYFAGLEKWSSLIKGGLLISNFNVNKPDAFQTVEELKSKITTNESGLTETQAKLLTLVLISHYNLTGNYFYSGAHKISDIKMMEALSSSEALYFVIIACNSGNFAQALANATGKNVWAFPEYVFDLKTVYFKGHLYEPQTPLVVSSVTRLKTLE